MTKKKKNKEQVSLFVFSGDKLSDDGNVVGRVCVQSPTATAATTGDAVSTNPLGFRKPEVEDFLFLRVEPVVVDVVNDLYEFERW